MDVNSLIVSPTGVTQYIIDQENEQVYWTLILELYPLLEFHMILFPRKMNLFFGRQFLNYFPYYFSSYIIPQENELVPWTQILELLPLFKFSMILSSQENELVP